MAIFQSGPIVGPISGNVGGACFVNTSGSNVIRQARRPSPADSQLQRIAQSRLLAAATAWRALTVLEQTAWRTYAQNIPLSNRLGTTRLISGYQTFLKIHMTRFNFTTVILADPPVVFLRQPIHAFQLSSSVASGIIIDFTDDDPTSGRTAYVYGHPFFRVTLPSSNNAWIFLATVVTTGALWDITTAWGLRFAQPILTQAIAVRVVPAIGPAFVPSTPIDLFALTTA